MRTKELFSIKNIIRQGLVEFGLIIFKKDIEIFVNNPKTFSHQKDVEKLVGKQASGFLEAISFDEPSFKKINETKKEISHLAGKSVVEMIKAQVIELNLKQSMIVVDCGFIINLSVGKEKLKDIKKGDFVLIKRPDLWVYDLEVEIKKE